MPQKAGLAMMPEPNYRRNHETSAQKSATKRPTNLDSLASDGVDSFWREAVDRCEAAEKETS